jgi:hypothetical protein
MIEGLEERFRTQAGISFEAEDFSRFAALTA